MAVGAGGGVSEVLGAGGVAGRKGGCVAGPAWEQPRAGSRLSSLGHAIGSKFMYPIACALCDGRAGEAWLPDWLQQGLRGRGNTVGLWCAVRQEARIWKVQGRRCTDCCWGRWWW